MCAGYAPEAMVEGQLDREALCYERLPGQKVRCNLCAHRCLVNEGRLGICNVRANYQGTLYTLVYGRTVSEHVDPVEKKPLLHFYPGSTAYSIATPGCNFHCRWCQNWQISQMPRDRGLVMGVNSSPEQIVERAKKTGCRSLAYTYTEPDIFFEYALETARLAHDEGLANIFVTNGYETPEALEIIGPYLDAANVDLKSFRDRTYRHYVGARLQPVLDTLKWLKSHGVWVEVTTLVIPGINDDPAELHVAAEFLAGDLGGDTPWHLGRFFPDYHMDRMMPTPIATLMRARELGREAGLQYIYIGNVPGDESTYCCYCSALLVRRVNFALLENRIEARDGHACCPDCGMPVAGIGMASSVVGC